MRPNRLVGNHAWPGKNPLTRSHTVYIVSTYAKYTHTTGGRLYG